MSDYEELDLRIKFAQWQTQAAAVILQAETASLPTKALTAEFQKEEAALKRRFEALGFVID